MQFDPGTEYYLHLFAFTNKEDEIIPANFEVAREQFAFKQNNYFYPGKNNWSISQNSFG